MMGRDPPCRAEVYHSTLTSNPATNKGHFSNVTDAATHRILRNSTCSILDLSTVDRLKSLRRTKLYDLLAALPLIAWFAFCGARILPTLVQQFLLVKLFIQTDPTVLPISLVEPCLETGLSGVCGNAHCVLRDPLHSAGKRSRSVSAVRCARGNLSKPRIRPTTATGVFDTALRDLPTPNDRWFCAGNMGNALARALDQHRTAGPAARYHGRLFLRAPSALSWRNGCRSRNCAAVQCAMGSLALSHDNAHSSSGASKMRNGYCWEFFLHMQNTQRGSRC